MSGNAGTLSKVLNPATVCWKANYNRDTIYIKDDSSRHVNTRRTTRISRKVSNSKEASNEERDTTSGTQELTARKLATVSGQRERPARAVNTRNSIVAGK
jgi:hypothetical protein